jgi:hypothetical protein
MKISIGLPNWLPNTPGPRLVEFARGAEAAGFASLGTIGRTVFDSHEELIVLAAAAGATPIQARENRWRHHSTTSACPPFCRP